MKVFLVFCLLSAGCVAAAPENCEAFKLEDHFSTYVVYEVARYRGGLTTENKALEIKGRELVMAENIFRYRDEDIHDPVYKVDCYLVSEEGDVQMQRFSNFYGFETGRRNILLLNVSEKYSKSSEAIFSFEVLNGEMWDLYDGWIYKLKKK